MVEISIVVIGAKWNVKTFRDMGLIESAKFLELNSLNLYINFFDTGICTDVVPFFF